MVLFKLFSGEGKIMVLRNDAGDCVDNRLFKYAEVTPQGKVAVWAILAFLLGMALLVPSVAKFV